jgi:hypothetical protein
VTENNHLASLIQIRDTIREHYFFAFDGIFFLTHKNGENRERERERERESEVN